MEISAKPHFLFEPVNEPNENSRLEKATSLKSLEEEQGRERRNICERRVLKNSSLEISGIQFFVDSMPCPSPRYRCLESKSRLWKIEWKIKARRTPFEEGNKLERSKYDLTCAGK